MRVVGSRLIPEIPEAAMKKLSRIQSSYYMCMQCLTWRQRAHVRIIFTSRSNQTQIDSCICTGPATVQRMTRNQSASIMMECFTHAEPKKQQRHAIKNSNAPRDKCIYRAHFSPMWANHIGQTLIGSLHQPNVEFHKNNLSSAVVYSDCRTALGPCWNPRGSRIFFLRFMARLGHVFSMQACFSSWAGSSWILVAHSNVALT